MDDINHMADSEASDILASEQEEKWYEQEAAQAYALYRDSIQPIFIDWCEDRGLVPTEDLFDTFEQEYTDWLLLGLD